MARPVEADVRPVSMIRSFPVGATWPTISDAQAAAAAHIPELGPQWEDAVVTTQYQNLAAGILLGILTPPVPPPTGASDIVFDSSYWNAPPT